MAQRTDAVPNDKNSIENTSELKPVFNADGLIPTIAQDNSTGEVLMMAWMNAEALKITITTRRVTYWSRSRNKLWEKGETSGQTQELISLKIDCDQDTLLLKVKQKGSACHTGERTCFYRTLDEKSETLVVC